ncbi:AAA family ATPase [Porphyromonas pogonae]|uniref:AAA family ATPase n=1 Tax=Porphyromonas pogonae TaxID=867595 RepID=UPI002E7A36D4|nr:ATP-binding protein [Porphyromonas pogonae]
MVRINNPFVTGGYVSDEYFCDRKKESSILIREIVNGNNVAIVSTRRMGKTGLIQHCFHSKELSKGYYKFFVDIYASKSLRDFTFALSKVILEGLKPFGRKAMEKFVNSVLSLSAGITFDVMGNPFFNVQLGDIHNSEATLEEIFEYLSKADKPCIVGIDEFQQITGYPESNVEALLRTHIQHCHNAHFIFAGSQRHTMGNMFLSASRPFYQSVSMIYLESIDLKKYINFACKHFEAAHKSITPETITAIYERFHGITWYMQKILNILFSTTPPNTKCDILALDDAIASIVTSFKFTYQEILFRLPEKQRNLLIAISHEGEARAITSGEFVKRYSLSSPSSVQSALNGLLEKDFITKSNDAYRVYDLFFDIWIRENY